MKSFNYLAITIGLLNVMYGASAFDNQYTSIFTPIQPYNFFNSCTTPGLMCESCTKLVNCIQQEGHFETIDVQTCDSDEGESCKDKKCVKEPNPLCEVTNPGFKCTATAIFPDPFDCKIYHVCAMAEDSVDGSSSHVTAKCKGNWGYDVVSTFCKVSLTGGVCPSTPPVPVCKTPGQIGALGNLSFYYVCVQVKDKLHPELYMCPHGTKFSSGKCA